MMMWYPLISIIRYSISVTDIRAASAVLGMNSSTPKDSVKSAGAIISRRSLFPWRRPRGNVSPSQQDITQRGGVVCEACDRVERVIQTRIPVLSRRKHTFDMLAVEDLPSVLPVFELSMVDNLATPHGNKMTSYPFILGVAWMARQFQSAHSGSGSSIVRETCHLDRRLFSFGWR